MKPVIISLLVAIFALVSDSLMAVPRNYVAASADVKEYVVDSITNCICSGDVILVQRRYDEFRREEYLEFPCASELGMDTFRCVEVFKGDESIGNYNVIFLYDTPRIAHALPKLHYWISELGESGYSIRENGVTQYLRGKKLWPYLPPYDPYSSMVRHEYVELRFVFPVKSPIMERVRFGEDYYIINERHAIPASKNMRADELVKMLGVERAFSNKVYQAVEGCLFQVDFPVPELEWKEGLMTKEDERALIQSYRDEADATLMHLSSDEVSEIVYLSYLADKRYTAADYDAACRRCPKILKPVKEFKTEIGKRLKAAMESGGMLPEK